MQQDVQKPMISEKMRALERLDPEIDSRMIYLNNLVSICVDTRSVLYRNDFISVVEKPEVWVNTCNFNHGRLRQEDY